MVEERESRKGKSAELTARRIEQMIIQRGWPSGEVLGSESELIERYGVSRAVFREAVRLLEHHFVARMRPGPGGGLVVTTPDTAAVKRAAALYLEYERASVPDLFDARIALEMAGVDLASTRVDEAEVDRLRAVIAAEEVADYDLNEGTSTCGLVAGADVDFHVHLAQSTGNPALALFVEILTSLVAERAAPFTAQLPRGDQLDASKASRRAHAAVVEAVVAGDTALARRRLLRHLGDVREWMHSAEQISEGGNRSWVNDVVPEPPRPTSSTK